MNLVGTCLQRTLHSKGFSLVTLHCTALAGSFGAVFSVCFASFLVSAYEYPCTHTLHMFNLSWKSLD